MHELAACLVAILGAILVLQVVPTVLFLVGPVRHDAVEEADEAYPRVTVVLCLRGHDPFLVDCVRGLIDQDYPCYKVRIIVDNQQDPAWQVVERLLQETAPPHVHLEVLERRLTTCALKCSSLLQAASRFDPSDEVIALLDSDTVPHRTWLRELVAPLRDEQVGVASGNRWYRPSKPTWGSLVRYIWNAAAVVQMYWNRFTWGGAVAVRASLLRDSDLLDRWSQSISSDTVIYEANKKLGLRVAFVPSLLMINRESCTLPSFFGWVQRQLLVAKLYHPRWPVVLAHGVGTTAVLGVALGVLVAGLYAGSWTVVAWLAAVLAVYLLVMAGLLMLLEFKVRRLHRGHGNNEPWLTPAVAGKLLLAMPVAQFAYAAALAKASFTRVVRWRGVTYRVDGPQAIRMVDYQPYRRDVQASEHLVSL